MDAEWESKPKPTIQMRELLIVPKSGAGMLTLGLGLLGGAVLLVLVAAAAEQAAWVLLAIAAVLAAVFVFSGLFTVGPNDAKVLQLFFHHTGHIRSPNALQNRIFLADRRSACKGGQPAAAAVAAMVCGAYSHRHPDDKIA